MENNIKQNNIIKLSESTTQLKGFNNQLETRVIAVATTKSEFVFISSGS
jgi:hypothetical protein